MMDLLCLQWWCQAGAGGGGTRAVAGRAQEALHGPYDGSCVGAKLVQQCLGGNALPVQRAVHCSVGAVEICAVRSE